MAPPLLLCGSTTVRPLRRPQPPPSRRASPASTVLSIRAAKDARPVRRVDARVRKHRQLEVDVAALRHEVARLQQLKRILEEQALNRADNHAGSACRLVKQYFDVFQRGYVPTSTRLDPDVFLAAMMDEDVLGGGFHGVDVMIEQWKRYGAAFVGTKIQFRTADVTSVDVDPSSGAAARIHVTATAHYAGHLTLAGVQSMFPHVMATPRLVMGLIGQVIGGLGRYTFVYDCEQKRVVENLIHIDLVSAFAKVVDSAADLGLLFGEALVTSQYYMGDDSETQADDSSTPSTPSTSMPPSEDEEQSGRQMSIDRILCEEERP